MLDRGAVVVGVDGSSVALDAVRWSARDAEAHGTDLVVVHAEPLITRLASTSPAAARLEHVRSSANRIVTEAVAVARRALSAASPVSVTGYLDDGPPVPCLLGVSGHARILVVGGTTRGSSNRTTPGAVAFAVLSHARCPVAVVRPYHRGRTAPAPVVLGVDGSPAGVPVVDHAFDTADRTGASITAVHARVDDVDRLGLAAHSPTAHDAQTDADALLDRALRHAERRYPHVAVRRIVVRDRPARSLLDHAHSAQLLVVGSHGRGGFDGMLLGSVARTVSWSAPCPVLVVRGGEHVADPIRQKARHHDQM